MKNLILIMLLFSSCNKEIKEVNQINSSSIDEAKIKVSVKDYGAKGDGVTDDRAAFQAAEDYLASVGGGILDVPKGVYIVSAPFYHRSFVTLRGRGDGSIIRNAITTKGTGKERFCIYIGNFDPSTFEECVHYDVNDIVAGSNQVTLKTAALFTVGQTVLIDTEDGFVSGKGKFKPYQAFINRVKVVNGLTITLEDPVSVNVFNAKIAPTNKFTSGKDTNEVYICQKPVIKNIRFESMGDWTLRFGVYKGLFENISLKTTDAIGGNGFSHCTFRNIRAEFSQKVIEMAMYSHNTTVDGLTATWWDGFIDPDMKPLFKMGENMRDCEFKNMTINSGQGKYFGVAMRFEHAFNNKITDSHFQCEAVAQNGIEFTTDDPASIVIDNVVSGNTFVFGNTDSYIKFDDENSGCILTNNHVVNNTFSGTVRKQPVINLVEQYNEIIYP